LRQKSEASVAKQHTAQCHDDDDDGSHEINDLSSIFCLLSAGQGVTHLHERRPPAAYIHLCARGVPCRLQCRHDGFSTSESKHEPIIDMMLLTSTNSVCPILSSAIRLLRYSQNIGTHILSIVMFVRVDEEMEEMGIRDQLAGVSVRNR